MIFEIDAVELDFAKGLQFNRFDHCFEVANSDLKTKRAGQLPSIDPFLCGVC